MIRKIVYAIAAVAALGAVAAVVLGPWHFRNLVGTGRARLQEQAREFTDPAVELQTLVRNAEKQLPKEIVALRMALDDLGKELTTQATAISETTEGLRLIEADLERLAAAVHSGSACKLRGRHLDPTETAQEAARLMLKRSEYQGLIRRRTALVANLREQRGKFEEELAAAEAILLDFANGVKRVEGKLALVKAMERIQTFKGITNSHRTSAPSTLNQLDRDLDRRLAETEERSKLRDGVSAPDTYAEAARQSRLLAELKEIYPAQEKED
jgi:hypothetical protein